MYDIFSIIDLNNFDGLTYRVRKYRQVNHQQKGFIGEKQGLQHP